MRVPLKQGLKRNGWYSRTWCCKGCDEGSIKTRIETVQRAIVDGYARRVAMRVPLKQGLKHIYSSKVRPHDLVAMRVPLKQGLKLDVVIDVVIDVGGCDEGSIKTRIETITIAIKQSHSKKVAMRVPLKQGLKLKEL